MNAAADLQKLDGEILPPQLAVRAMRDSGYRNTAYALAELIDNSIQSGAKDVAVICLQTRQLVKERETRRMNSIAVVDNGSGMTGSVLRRALQFGNGTHKHDRDGIGRFGMGLPNSSISQCKRVEVWTWQSGPDNALYSYLDVDEIDSGAMRSVPVPFAKPVPQEWRELSDAAGTTATTGTLVVWSRFDEERLTWRGAKSTLEHTEIVAGRMYRKFIDDGRVEIRLLAYDDENLSKPLLDSVVRVNDPLYLMKNSSTPEPFDKAPMFQPWGDGVEKFPIDFGGQTHTVEVRMSWATEATVPEDGSNRGAKPYGKHAMKNLGVSIVRAGRELMLDPAWTNSYDPVERWWGVEVEFPPSLDEVFGVTNNKQSATIFSEMVQFNWEAEADDGELRSDFCERIAAEGDPRGLLIPIVDHIRKQIIQVRKRLESQTKGTRTKVDRHQKPSIEDLATTKFRERAKQGHEAAVDKVEFGEKEKQDLVQDLTEDKGYGEDVAEKIAEATLKKKRKVIFTTKAMEGYGFFNVDTRHGGVTQVVFNTNHPLHKQLWEMLKPETEAETDKQLLARINSAADTLELLFAAWARYELEEVRQQSKLFEMRQEWGKMARLFLEDDE